MDLLVVGGGVAGMAAAAHAAARGAHVTLIEKTGGLGGSAALSAGIVWTAPDEATFRRVCPDGDPELGRTLVDGFDAAVERARETGVPVSDRWTGQMGFGVAHRVDMQALVERWREAIEAAGGRIDLGASARELLRDEDGGIRGARVATAATSAIDIEIAADAVLLATGGFQGDPSLVRAAIGPGAESMPLRSHRGATGDGLRMARAAGAADASGPGDGFYGHLVPSPLGRWGPDDFLPLTQYHSRQGVLVNRDGRRFAEEWRGDEVSTQAALRQPGRRALLLFDERVRHEHAVGPPYPHGQEVDRLALAEEVGARVTHAPTLKRLIVAIAAWGVDADCLAATLAARPDCLREPPFHALEVQPSITFPFGGVRADADGHVLDSEGRPLPGLFAAGADVGGLQGPGYVGGLVLGLVFGPRAADAALDGATHPRRAPQGERAASHAGS
jgi:succinate dehydrogenase/fumarate reductase flavoprotein subunit